MRKYELVCIVHPDLDETAFNGAVDKVKGWISDFGGSVDQVDVWGRRRLAYAIGKQREGNYVLLHAQLDPASLNELDRNLRFHEPVIRFMITQAN